MDTIRKFLPLISAALCVVLLILLLLDAVRPSMNVFNSQGVKVYILITGLVAALDAILLIARNREAIRRRNRRQAARRGAPRR